MLNIAWDYWIAFGGGVFTGIVITVLWIITGSDHKQENSTSICADCEHSERDDKGKYFCLFRRHWITGEPLPCIDIRKERICSSFQKRKGK